MMMKLAFESVGSGPPVVILHGLFGSGSNWRSVAQAMASTYRVITIDLRNHGASPWADSMSYVEMARDVHDVIVREGLRKPAVIGHSMGGKTAMALALLHPILVGRLTVVAVSLVSYADRLSPYVEAMRSIDMMAAASHAEVQRRLAQSIPDAGIVAFLMQNLVARNDHFDWRLNLMTIGASLRELGEFPPELRKRRFDRPTSLIVGSQSDYVKPADRLMFEAMFPCLEVTVIEGAGHWVHADRPDEFLATVRHALDAAT